MKRSLFIILGALCFAIAGKAQGSDVSVQKKNTGYSILNDSKRLRVYTLHNSKKTVTAD